jgi:hypothetical protein
MSKIRDKLFITLDPSHRVGHFSFSAKDDEGRFWDALVGAETETVDNGDGTFTHSTKRTPPAKSAQPPTVRKQPDVVRALLDMDCTGEDDLVC